MLNLAAIGLCAFLQAQSELTQQARELIEKLRSEKIEDRQDAARKLKALGKSALQELEKAAKDSDPEVRIVAMHVIRVIGLKEHLSPKLLKVFPGLEERLGGDDGHEWTKALLDAAAADGQGLRKYPDLERWDLEALFAPALKGAREEEEKTAIVGLAEALKTYSAIPEILKQIRDPKVGIHAIVALSGLDAWEAAPDLRALIDDKDAWIQLRAAAVRALGSLKVKEAIPRLIELSKDPELSRSVFQAMGEIGSPEAIPSLVKALKSTDPWDSWTAAHALGQLGAKEGIPELLTLLDNRNEVQLRAAAARSLPDRGATHAISKIEGLLDETDGFVLDDACRALGVLGAKESLPKITLLLHHKSAQVRRTAVCSVDALGGEGSTGILRESLKDIDSSVRVSAATFLASRGHPDGVAVILQDVDFLMDLNPLRCPELWKRLAKTKFHWDRPEYTLREFMEGISKQSGLAVEGPPDPDGRFTARMSERWRGMWDGPRTVVDAMEWFALNCPYDVILEQDRIRILPTSEARNFWKAWESAEVKKKK